MQEWDWKTNEHLIKILQEAQFSRYHHLYKTYMSSVHIQDMFMILDLGMFWVLTLIILLLHDSFL